MSASFSPEARTSCARCHKRKKRCDRGLPACKNCQLARVRCSFLDSGSQTTASYPITYVRSLEARVQALENRITISSSPQARQLEHQILPQLRLVPDGQGQRAQSENGGHERGDTLEKNAEQTSPATAVISLEVAEPIQTGDINACDMFLEQSSPLSCAGPGDETSMADSTATRFGTVDSVAASKADELTMPSMPQLRPRVVRPQTHMSPIGPESPQFLRHPPSVNPHQMQHSQYPHPYHPPPPATHVPTPPHMFCTSSPRMSPSQLQPQTQLKPTTGELPSFAQELKSLSLEAAAERHVGSSSGVSFAKLTQMVLCRLTPDKADFVFSNDTAGSNTGVSAGTSGGGNSSSRAKHTMATTAARDTQECAVVCGTGIGDPQLVDFDSPSDLFNASVLHSLGESISVYPLLFGDVFLTDIMEPTTALDGLTWPPTTVADSDGVGNEDHVNILVDFYFAHSNTLYPIIARSEFMATLQLMREDSQAAVATLSSLSLFRIWMVLAIGATAFSSVSLTEESEPMLYYNKALQYSEQALALDEMAALEVLTLQVSYSFFSQLGPNTWFLVGMAARVALGLGLHTAATYEKLPVNVAERRKRIFFSIYMMDRVVSIALGRPFAVHDDDIDVTPFAAVDDECIKPEKILPQSSLQPSIMCVPLHILSLRQIASRIARQVYSSLASRQSAQNESDVAQREKILTDLHQELIDWRRNMPFPLPDIDSRVPHLSSTWYDFNYYTHLASIYRPSPLFPVMDEKRVKILESAAAMAVRHAYNLHQQRRFAYNWLNFLSLFTATLSLIYATTAQPSSLTRVLRETRAIEDLELAIELFSTLSVKFSAARKIRGMIAEICKRYRDVKDSS